MRDGVLDYAKILVRSPFNMAVNVMDAVQLTRASIAGGYRWLVCFLMKT
jgi:hypothetical protein